MEVTCDNWYEVRDDVLQAVKESDFFSFDLEMTGLSMTDGIQADDDTASMRYQQAADSPDFVAIQIGISMFTFGPKTKEGKVSLTARTFNVPLRMPKSQRFTVHSWVLDFLRRNHFDFNHWIEKGLGFIPADEDRAVAAHIKKSRVELTPELQKTLDATVAHVKAALAENPAALKIDLQHGLERDEIAAIRQHLHTQPAFADMPIVGVRFWACEFAASKEEAAAIRARHDFNGSLEGRIGIRSVLDAIGETGKPVVSHNGFLDWVFIIRQFYSKGLMYPRHKAEIARRFPVLRDTRAFLTAHPLPLTEDEAKKVRALGTFYEHVKDAVHVTWAEGHDRYADDGPAHEAGWDSFMTGVLMAAIACTGDDPMADLMAATPANGIPVHRTPQMMVIGGEDGPVPVDEVKE